MEDQKREVTIVGYLTKERRRLRATLGSETFTVDSLEAFTKAVGTLRNRGFYMVYEIQKVLIQPTKLYLGTRTTNLGPIDVALLYLQGRVDATVTEGKLVYSLPKPT